MKKERAGDPLIYYGTQGPMTDPAEHAGWFENLPTALPDLVRLVQGLLLHIFWSKCYGVEPTGEREAEAGCRRVVRMLSRIGELDRRPLTAARPPEQRLVGNCRTFSVLLCALLRHQGVPARARCGFGTYFEAGRYEDHWVGECWDGKRGRWVLVDAQLDELQCRALKVPLDPLDVPRDQFLVGGAAWQLCRSGAADPDRFGILHMHGLWFVRGNLVRDLAALNKAELLPWDAWGLIDRRDEDLTEDDLALLDRVAALTAGEIIPFDQVRAAYLGDERLRVSPLVRSYSDAGVLTVEVATEKLIS